MAAAAAVATSILAQVAVSPARESELRTKLARCIKVPQGSLLSPRLQVVVVVVVVVVVLVVLVVVEAETLSVQPNACVNLASQLIYRQLANLLFTQILCAKERGRLRQRVLLLLQPQHMHPACRGLMLV